MPASLSGINPASGVAAPVAKDYGRLQAFLARARANHQDKEGENAMPAQKNALCRKNFKIRVDTESGRTLYTPHQDGVAAGGALYCASSER
jgi:hypothetical protein